MCFCCVKLTSKNAACLFVPQFSFLQTPKKLHQGLSENGAKWVVATNASRKQNRPPIPSLKTNKHQKGIYAFCFWEAGFCLIKHDTFVFKKALQTTLRSSYFPNGAERFGVRWTLSLRTILWKWKRGGRWCAGGGKSGSVEESEVFLFHVKRGL